MSTEKIAKYTVDSNYDMIPEAAITISKKAILDCLGVTLAAVKEPGCSFLSEYIKEEQGRPLAGVIGCGFKTTAAQAAWANGNMAHALDFDDWSPLFIGHPTVAILPAVLALGQEYRISGKEALLAYVVGFEVGARIGRAVIMEHYLTGWHATGTLGSIAAGVAAAKIMKLSLEETQVTIGIAASLAGGLKQNFGTMTKPLHAGNAAKNGVIAAKLAQKGFTADKNILEAPQGFCKVFAGGRGIDLTNMTSNLDGSFDIIEGLVLKAWPSCGGTHTSIEAALHLKEKHNIEVDDIAEIEIHCDPAVRSAVIHSRPKAGLEGKFSNEYCIARALLSDAVKLNDFTDDRVRQDDVQALLKKVVYIEHSDEQSDPELNVGIEISIKLKDKRYFSKNIKAAKGSFDNPLTWDEISTKFIDCASIVISKKDAVACLEMVSNLESLADISLLADLLTQG